LSGDADTDFLAPDGRKGGEDETADVIIVVARDDFAIDETGDWCSTIAELGVELVLDHDVEEDGFCGHGGFC